MKTDPAVREAAPAVVDLQDHLAALEKAGAVQRIDQPVNKDTELHPLVRWQYRGGLPDHQRKAFLFTDVRDSLNRRFDMPVVVGALAANREIYRIGMGVPLDRIGEHWTHAINNPLAPTEVTNAACQQIVLTDLTGQGKGLDALPVPISTPGFDSAPYITAGMVVTRDPDTGIQNLGTYRAGPQGPQSAGRAHGGAGRGCRRIPALGEVSFPWRGHALRNRDRVPSRRGLYRSPENPSRRGRVGYRRRIGGLSRTGGPLPDGRSPRARRLRNRHRRSH